MTYISVALLSGHLVQVTEEIESAYSSIPQAIQLPGPSNVL